MGLVSLVAISNPFTYSEFSAHCHYLSGTTCGYGFFAQFRSFAAVKFTCAFGTCSPNVPDIGAEAPQNRTLHGTVLRRSPWTKIDYKAGGSTCHLAFISTRDRIQPRNSLLSRRNNMLSFVFGPPRGNALVSATRFRILTISSSFQCQGR